MLSNKNYKITIKKIQGELRQKTNKLPTFPSGRLELPTSFEEQFLKLSRLPFRQDVYFI